MTPHLHCILWIYQYLEKSGWDVEFAVVVVGVTGMSRSRGGRLGITNGNLRALELRVARRSWEYVRSI